MAKRKTIEIKALIEKVNACMENSPNDARMERLAIASFLSNVLMDANAYSGFGYLKDYHDPGKRLVAGFLLCSTPLPIGIANMARMQLSLAQEIQNTIDELDAMDANVSQYRNAMSTLAKKPLRKGETWRDRLVNWQKILRG